MIPLLNSDSALFYYRLMSALWLVTECGANLAAFSESIDFLLAVNGDGIALIETWKRNSRVSEFSLI